MNGKKECATCKRVDPPYGIGKDGCCLDIQACLEAFALQDMAEEADRNAGSH